jgi:hypothetical protein
MPPSARHHAQVRISLVTPRSRHRHRARGLGPSTGYPLKPCATSTGASDYSITRNRLFSFYCRFLLDKLVTHLLLYDNMGKKLGEVSLGEILSIGDFPVNAC